MSSSKSKAGDFPKTESEAGEFPKMEVKPLDYYIPKTEPGEFLKREPLYFPKTEARDFPKMEQHTFPEAETHTSFFHKEESACGSGTSTLTSSESTISGISSMKSLMRKRDLMCLLLSYPLVITDDSGVSDLKRELYYERPLPLRYVGGLIPMEIIRDAERGERSWSISSDGDLIPEAILNLAADLAVDQSFRHCFPFLYINIRTISNTSGYQPEAALKKEQ